MGLAANCLRFVEALGVTAEGAAGAYALVEDLRRTLESAPALPGLFPLFFRLRLAGVMGFAPNLESCGQCGAPLEGGGQFVVDEGQMRCPVCRAASDWRGYGVELRPAGPTFCGMCSKKCPPVGAWTRCPPRTGGPAPGPSTVLCSTTWGWPGKRVFRRV